MPIVTVHITCMHSKENFRTQNYKHAFSTLSTRNKLTRKAEGEHLLKDMEEGEWDRFQESRGGLKDKRDEGEWDRFKGRTGVERRRERGRVGKMSGEEGG